MIIPTLCYSATLGSSVADYGKPCRVDMGNVGPIASSHLSSDLLSPTFENVWSFAMIDSPLGLFILCSIPVLQASKSNKAESHVNPDNSQFTMQTSASFAP